MSDRHSDELRGIYRSLIEHSGLQDHFIDLEDGRQVHLLEKGEGPTVVILHGTGNSAGFFLPLLENLNGVAMKAVDRPGFGLSDRVDLPIRRYRDASIDWLDRLMDRLDLNNAVLAGNSMGGVWSIWYALSRPRRVSALILIGGAPLLPGTRIPLPFKLVATPGLGEVLGALPSTKESILKFAEFIGERETLSELPGILNLQVASDRDPVSSSTAKGEARSIISPYALVSSPGWRAVRQIKQSELEELAVPTMMIWGQNEPVGDVSTARAISNMIPQARLEVVPSGHAPWLGNPRTTAELVGEFARGQS